jgi:Protein of unknown function (DUF4199)
MKLSLLFIAIAITARVGLFYSGIELQGFTFGFILMGLVVLLAFLSGHFLLREEREAPFPALFRQGLRSTALFALLYALFIVAYYAFVDTGEYPMRINGLVHDAVVNGQTEAEARPKLEAFFNPGKEAMITFFGLLILGAVNALFFAVVHHKLLRRFA